MSWSDDWSYDDWGDLGHVSDQVTDQMTSDNMTNQVTD